MTLTQTETEADLFFSESLETHDPELAAAIREEEERQQDHIELIASENIVSRAVLEAQGSVLTNKYAEGYPGRRYYGGCEFVDVAEQLAIDRAKKLFDCELRQRPAAFRRAGQRRGDAWRCLSPATPFMGMSLAAGGHLTHGAPPDHVGQVVQRGASTACAATPSRSTSTRSSGWPPSTSPS